MKFAFCVEDETDQTVLARLMARIMNVTIEPDSATFRFPVGGWSNALRLAPHVARHAYHAGLDGAVFAIDNDDAEPLHTSTHAVADANCRVCALRAAADVDAPSGWPRPEMPPIRYIFAVPVRTLETWLLLAKGHTFPGHHAAHGLRAHGRRVLKRLLYGTTDPDRQTMLSVGLPIAESADLDALARISPSFEAFRAQLA